MKHAAALSLVFGLASFSSAAVVRRDLAPYATFNYCSPSQSCWPSTADWTAFNQTINGNLVAVTPWAAPCYPASYDAAACAFVQQNYLDQFARADAIGASEELNWEDCLGENCWLLSILPQTPQLGTCSLGRLSPYAVNASSSDDIVKAVNFAYSKKIKLVIKNTGHEYVGRSSGPDTLTIFTHNLKSTSYNANFIPQGCIAAPVTAVTLGAGTQAREAYKLAGDNGKSITLGAYGSVGVAGGFAMGGGHGPMGPTYGLAVDNIRQYKIVTYDGVLRIANACSNSDLYFALRGGGGGSWGVVTEVTYEVHPQTQIQHYSIYVSSNLVSGLLNTDGVIQDFVTQLAKYQTSFSDAKGAGYTFMYAGTAGIASNFSIDFGFPTSNIASVIALTAPLTAYLSTNLNYVVTKPATVTTFNTLQDYVNSVITPGGSNTPVGFAERLAGRLLPRSLFANSTGQTAIAQAININVPPVSAQLLVNAIKPQAIQIYSTGPSNMPDGSQTGVNTAWRGSLWEVVYSSGWTQYFPQAIRQGFATATSKAMDPLRALTPGGGCYYSEADQLEPDWQTAFFGSNYARLQSIKQKYDPQNYFNVYKGVAWTGPDNSFYRCYNNA